MALDPLGVENGLADRYESDVDRSKAIQTGASMVRERLEGYVVQIAAESAEIGCPETTDTLRMQAIGMLIALRELQRHIPEICE